jgi:hypothetical protein
MEPSSLGPRRLERVFRVSRPTMLLRRQSQPRSQGSESARLPEPPALLA